MTWRARLLFAAILPVWAAMAAMHVHTDYYSTLQVSPNASSEEIRVAYKQRAMALHPDKNMDASATKEFQRLVEAYSVLKDPQKRAQYDARGHHDEEEEEDDDDYSDEEYDDGVHCNCPFHHQHGGASFSSYFEELFARHYSQYGYRGFFYDEDSDRNFFRKFSAKNSGRFGTLLAFQELLWLTRSYAFCVFLTPHPSICSC